MKSSLSENSLAQLTLVRFREFLREPEAVFWVFLFPIILAAGLGLAFRNRPAEVLKVGAVTPEIARSLRQEKLLDVHEYDLSGAREALRAGKIAMFAEPGGLDKNGLGKGVQYEYDDTNPDGRTARMIADDAIQRAGGRVNPVPASELLMREPGSRYIDFLLPGLLGMNLMGSSIWGLSFAVVDARRRKLLKRLIATPMPRHEYLMSFLLSRLLMLVVEVGTLVGFGMLVFHVPLRGSFAGFAVLCVFSALAFSSIGLLVASRVRTIEAVSGIANLVMMPMWILSGVFFSAQRFPDAIQPVIRALPLTALIDALRAMMLQGASLSALWPQLAILGAWLIVAFSLALKLFRWR